MVVNTASLIQSIVLAITDTGWIDGHIAWVAFHTFAMGVLTIPYRNAMAWSWYITWILPVPFLVVGINRVDEPAFGPFYLGAAIVLTAAQTLTRPSFTQPRSPVP